MVSIGILVNNADFNVISLKFVNLDYWAEEISSKFLCIRIRIVRPADTVAWIF